jgi:hypothetical protein
MKMNLDVVNGIVIGPVTFRVDLYTPNGKQYGQRCFETESEAREWALATLTAARAEVGPDESRRLGWDKPWEVRFYD